VIETTGRQKIKSMIVSWKKKWKIDQHTLKAQRKFFFTYEFGPTTKKICLNWSLKSRVQCHKIFFLTPRVETILSVLKTYYSFKVDIGPYKESLIKAYGPGLEGGAVGYPADFIVETNGETGSLGFSIEGPSQAKIDCIDNMDGSANVTYWPTAVGEYAVHILCDNDDIPGSPFMAWIEQKGNFDATKVLAYGPGMS